LLKVPPGTLISGVSAERPSAGLSNPDAADGLASLKVLALCGCKSGLDETRYRFAGKAVKEHGRVVDTERDVDKQLKRPALLRAEMTFSRKARHLRPLKELLT
jgi:hypothetical protein